MPFSTDEAIADDDFNVWLCGSFNKNQGVMDDIFKAINPIHTARVAGSGNKIVYLLDKKAEYY
jgi:hypothetical protein